jgi:hypothetical protein
MKHSLVVLFALMFAVVLRADGDFTKTMTPEELEATGLAKLTPEELARLKIVIERYRSGEVAVVEKKAEQQVAAVKKEAEQQVVAVKQEAETKVTVVKQEAETKVAAAEAKAREAETKATTKSATATSEPKKKEPNWLAALVTLEKTGKDPDKAEAVETRLVGSLSTFSGSRRFELENGQVWQMVEPASYSGPTLKSPVVTIRPGSFGMFWLKIPEGAVRVKVKPIKLQ